MNKTTTEHVNINRPGLPDYIGPARGWFALLHHDTLYEWSNNVMERVNYVSKTKPVHEIAARLHNMLYLDLLLCPAVTKRKLLDDDYAAKRKLLNDDYAAKRKLLYDDYVARRKPLDDDHVAKCKLLELKVLPYIKSEIPDCAWDGFELQF